MKITWGMFTGKVIRYRRDISKVAEQEVPDFTPAIERPTATVHRQEHFYENPKLRNKTKRPATSTEPNKNNLRRLRIMSSL
jgi:hypothetical protein